MGLNARQAPVRNAVGEEGVGEVLTSRGDHKAGCVLAQVSEFEFGTIR